MRHSLIIIKHYRLILTATGEKDKRHIEIEGQPPKFTILALDPTLGVTAIKAEQQVQTPKVHISELARDCRESTERTDRADS